MQSVEIYCKNCKQNPSGDIVTSKDNDMRAQGKYRLSWLIEIGLFLATPEALSKDGNVGRSAGLPLMQNEISQQLHMVDCHEN